MRSPMPRNCSTSDAANGASAARLCDVAADTVVVRGSHPSRQQEPRHPAHHRHRRGRLVAGQGLTASSLGQLLSARGLSVTMQKLDPYLNVDPGTMNPFQHGEVFVTDDGSETDLDIGHYERFLSVDLNAAANVTTGQVYSSVIAKERRGDYLGDTVQVIPHITDEIKARIVAMATPEVDVVITEVGGTVGDIESQPFLEAVRQLRQDLGRERVLPARVAAALHRAVRRVEDQADAALGGGAALHRRTARRHRAALGPRGAEDIKRKISRFTDVDLDGWSPPRCRQHLRHPQGAARRGP